MPLVYSCANAITLDCNGVTLDLGRLCPDCQRLIEQHHDPTTLVRIDGVKQTIVERVDVRTREDAKWIPIVIVERKQL